MPARRQRIQDHEARRGRLVVVGLPRRMHRALEPLPRGAQPRAPAELHGAEARAAQTIDLTQSDYISVFEFDVFVRVRLASALSLSLSASRLPLARLLQPQDRLWGIIDYDYSELI